MKWLYFFLWNIIWTPRYLLKGEFLKRLLDQFLGQGNSQPPNLIGSLQSLDAIPYNFLQNIKGNQGKKSQIHFQATNGVQLLKH